MSFFKNLTPQQRLSKNAIAIWEHPKYTSIAGTLMIGERTVDFTIPTACTNGRDEWYSAELIENLNDPELRFVILHENRHKISRHLKIYKTLSEINCRVANMAMDLVINLEITDENKDDNFAVMPTGKYAGLLDERFRGMAVPQVFKILLEEEEGNDPEGGEGGEGGDGPTDNTLGEEGEPSNSGVPSGGGFDEHDWDGAGDLTEEEKKDLEHELDQAIREGAMAAGKLGGNSLLSVEELLKPTIDWKDVLREFVHTTCAGKDFGTWARPNRRYIGSGVYLPSTLSETVEELVLAIDTSGSVAYYANLFLSEVAGICQTVRPERVRLIYWDHRVQKEEVYEQEQVQELVHSTSPEGGGGTTIEVVCEYLKENRINPQAIIVFTDGYLAGSWGEWKHPLLWCVLDNKDAKPNTGKVVHINSQDFK